MNTESTEKKPSIGSSHLESSGELSVVVDPHSDRNTSCVFICGLEPRPPLGDYLLSKSPRVPEAVPRIPEKYLGKSQAVVGEQGTLNAKHSALNSFWGWRSMTALPERGRTLQAWVSRVPEAVPRIPDAWEKHELAGDALWERSILPHTAEYSAPNIWKLMTALPAQSRALQAGFSIVSKATPELDDALEDLRECQDEAREKSFPIPTVTALNNAERLLKSMFSILPRRFEVYPMPSGAIAIQASKAPEVAISVLCESDGGALCLVSALDHSRRARYSTANYLPDGFLLEALQDLRRFGG